MWKKLKRVLFSKEKEKEDRRQKKSARLKESSKKVFGTSSETHQFTWHAKINQSHFASSRDNS